MPALVPLLAVLALLLIVASAASSRVPLWVGVILLCVALLVMTWG